MNEVSKNKRRIHILWFFVGVFLIGTLVTGLEVGEESLCSEGFGIMTYNGNWACIDFNDIFSFANFTVNDLIVLNTTLINTTNITADYVHGWFNWTTDDYWNIFNGYSLTFNESMLSTISYNITGNFTINQTNSKFCSPIKCEFRNATGYYEINYDGSGECCPIVGSYCYDTANVTEAIESGDWCI